MILLFAFSLLIVKRNFESYFFMSQNVKIGDAIDSLNGVIVYYNGKTNHVSSRNISSDGYNLGLEFQCVEFVKRYYYEFFDHKMPNSYGHAKNFFDPNIKDGEINPERGLTQYSNPSNTKPQISDLVIFSGSIFNEYGHVAIISKVTENEIEIIQQNVGTQSRDTFSLKLINRQYKINHSKIIGWLRIPK